MKEVMCSSGDCGGDGIIYSILGLIEEAESILLLPHVRADGDAIGSCLALRSAICRKYPNKRVEFVLLSPLSDRYRFIFSGNLPLVLGSSISIDSLPSFDLIIAVDTAVREQLEPAISIIDSHKGRIVAIDHHSHWDLEGDIRLIDEAASATGLIIARIIDRMMGGRLDKEIAEYLLLAIGTDTGWFSYNNTTADCYYWAYKCLEAGADNRWLYENLFLSDSIERFRLLAKAYSSAEIYADGKIVTFTLYRKDFEQTGSVDAHTENIVDQGCRLKDMLVAVLFCEQSADTVRISLRSRSCFDVNQFAQKFGGGGHPCAAGIRMKGRIDDVKRRVLEELLKDIGVGC